MTALRNNFENNMMHCLVHLQFNSTFCSELGKSQSSSSTNSRMVKHLTKPKESAQYCHTLYLLKHSFNVHHYLTAPAQISRIIENRWRTSPPSSQLWFCHYFPSFMNKNLTFRSNPNVIHSLGIFQVLKWTEELTADPMIVVCTWCGKRTVFGCCCSIPFTSTHCLKSHSFGLVEIVFFLHYKYE